MQGWCQRCGGWNAQPRVCHRLPDGGDDAIAVAVALAVAVAVAVALPLAVKRTEHRSGDGGGEAHVSERSELWAVLHRRETRRGPAGFTGRFAPGACFLFGYFFFAGAKKK